MKRILSALIALPLLLVTTLVFASPQSDASRIFDEGRKLYEEGKFADALSKFKNTLALNDSPNARLYLARTLHELGRPVEAYEEMLRTRQQAESSDDPKYVHTRDIAAARLALLEKEIGRVIVLLSDDYEPVELTVGGRAIPQVRAGEIIPVTPGKVAVVATKPGGEEIRQEVKVAAGALVTVPLDVTDEAPATPGAAPVAGTQSQPVPDQPVEEEGGLGATTTTGIVLASVGVVGMGVFGVAGAMALDKHSTISDECGGSSCPEARYNDEIDDGQTLQTVANVGFAVGVGGLVLGTALIVIGSLSGDDDGPSDDVAVQAGPGGAFIGYSGTF